MAEDIDMLLQGEAQSLEETSNDLLLTYAFAFVIVFLVLVAQFESLTSALVVILTVPFALGGGGVRAVTCRAFRSTSIRRSGWSC